MSMVRRSLLTLLLVVFGSLSLTAQNVPKPVDFFGFEPGANYKLIDNDQLEAYYRAVAESSDRVLLQEIGETHHGNKLLLLIISSEENLANLDRYREISERLALAKGLTDGEARKLAKEGKAVIWIDSGMHSTELAHSQHNPEFVYYMATDESPETRKMREEVILLNMPMMNPDGHNIVVDWYRKQRDTEFALTNPPVVYHEYVGHDNNRDWFMLLQNESRAVAKVLYNQWYPQIVVNHHQMGAIAPRMFIPPFADPVNPNIPALAVRGTNLVGESMANRFAAEGKSGIIQGITFNMWWNGGMRTVPYFHNMVGILTESTHRSPVPRYWDEEDIPETIVRGGNEISMKEPSIFYPDPWEGGWSTMRQMVEYHLTASLGVMDIAVERKDTWLYNMYLMGRDAIEKGKTEEPYAYVISPDQWDPAEAIKMLKILQRGGIEVHRAASDFEMNGTDYPEGSYVIYTSQAFRPYLVDLMEPQSYPDRRLYPGGPPEPPYDVAGWTLPIQMGVNVQRAQEPLKVKTKLVEEIRSFPASVSGGNAAGFLLSSHSNMAAILVNKLLADNHAIYRLTESVSQDGVHFDAGAFFIERRNDQTFASLKKMATTYGLKVTGVEKRPDLANYRVTAPKIGMYQSWTSPIDEGWTRWIFDNYGFNYTTLHDNNVREEDLSRFDIIIMPSMSSERILRGNEPGTMPEKYTGGLGVEGAFKLKKYVEGGGTILGWSGSVNFLVDMLGLPVTNTLRDIPHDEFFIPGSLVRVETDNKHRNAFGVQKQHGVFFGDRSAAFSVIEPAEAEDNIGAGPPVEIFARYADEDILLSGWAMGEDEYLSDKPAAVRVGLGKGEVVLIGFRPQFRAQTRATFKFVFNAIYSASSGEIPMVSTWAPAE